MEPTFVQEVDRDTFAIGQRMTYKNKEGKLIQTAELESCLDGGLYLYAKDKNGVEYTDNPEMYRKIQEMKNNSLNRQKEQVKPKKQDVPKNPVHYMPNVKLSSIQVGERMIFQGSDGYIYQSSAVSRVVSQNNNYYVQTASGSKYTTDKEYAMRHNPEFAYKEQWADYIASASLQLDKSPREMAEKVSYEWMGGTKPQTYCAYQGRRLVLGEIKPGMEIVIKSKSMIDISNNMERTDGAEARIKVKNVISNGQHGFIETQNALYYNIPGIAGLVSRDLHEQQQEMTHSMDERERQ